jgi:tetratricopeptide (TPR) repeat protein
LALVTPATAAAAAQLRWEVARVYMDRHEYWQARSECQALGKLPGANADGHACAADAHLVLLRASEALGEVAAALASDPGSYEARVAEGRAQDFALEVAKSEAAYRAAIAIRPDGVDAHVGLGRLLFKNGRREEGLALLRRGVELDPSGSEALFELGLALSPGAESVALLERATRERPTFGEAWLALGSEQLALRHLAEAKRASDAALREPPGGAAANVLAGRVALAEGRADEAIHSGEAALRIVGNSAPAKLLVADGNAKKGDIDPALEAYQAAWGLDHGDPTPLVHAAEACHAAGRETSARAYGMKATQEFPKWGPAWAALGDALVANGEKPAAREAYQKALAGDGLGDRDAVQRKLLALP